MVTRRYQNTPPIELPSGSMSLTRFAWLHGLRSEVITGHVRHGLYGCTDTSIPGRPRRYFTPDQQRVAMAFWDKQGIAYRTSVPAEKSEVMP